MKASDYFDLMFRTDMTKVKLNPKTCTTKPKKYLCSECEHNKLQIVDCAAATFWNNLSQNWMDKTPILLQQKYIITNIFLFTVVARGMFLSLRFNKKLWDALQTFMKDTPPYSDTKATLEEINFQIHYLQHDDEQRCRIELPFQCDINLNGNIVRTLCAQLPPFVILMPDTENDQVAQDVERNVRDIIPRIHSKLNDKLEEFSAESMHSEERSKNSRFNKWYHDLREKHLEPLLIFDYIRECIIQVSLP